MGKIERKANLRALFVVAIVVILAISLIACNTTRDDKPVAPTAISIQGRPSQDALEVGAAPVVLTYAVTPADASGYEIEWSVSDENVATILQNGQDSFLLTVTEAAPTINDLLGDLILQGVYNENAPEVERVPLDPDYVKLITRRESLMLLRSCAAES